MNSTPTGTLNWSAIKTSMMEGGIRIPKVPEDAIVPVARRGYDRDKKKGKLQVNFGVLANQQGIPAAVSVFKGNVGDQTYELPAGTELPPGEYTALVWCEAFSVEFVGATIQV